MYSSAQYFLEIAVDVTCMFDDLYTYLWIYIYMHIYVYMYIYIYVNIYVCIYVYMYIYVYTLCFIGSWAHLIFVKSMGILEKRPIDWWLKCRWLASVQHKQAPPVWGIQNQSTLGNWMPDTCGWGRNMQAYVHVCWRWKYPAMEITRLSTSSFHEIWELWIRSSVASENYVACCQQCFNIHDKRNLQTLDL